MLRLLLPLAPAVSTACAAYGEAPVAVRAGSHAGYGRIVFDAGAGARYALSRDGAQVILRFDDSVALAEPQRAPRNVSRLTTEGAAARFTVPPAAQIRAYRLGDRVVVDVFDPADPDKAADPTTAEAALPLPPRAPERPPTTQAKHTDPMPAATAMATKPVAASAQTPGATPEEPRRATPSAADTRTPGPPIKAPSEPASGVAAVASRSAAVPPTPVPVTPGPPVGAAAKTERGAPDSPSSSVVMAPSAPLTAPRIPVTPDPPPTQPGQAPRATVHTPFAHPPPTMARRLVAQPDTPTVALPFPETASAALFQRESTILVVFADRRAIDLSGLRDDPVFSGLTVRMLTNATLFSMPAPEGRGVSLTPTPQGWRLVVTPNSRPAAPIRPDFADSKVTLPTAHAAAVIPVTDPESGVVLLVGTVARQGDAVTTERRTPGFTLVPTLRRVVVEPLSDTLELRVRPPGFILSSPAFGLAFSPPAELTAPMLSAARLTRRFRFLAMATEGLADRIRLQVSRAASLLSLGRNPARKTAAETMVALGMAAEALLRVITDQDPRELTAPDTTMLKAIAALLNGRYNDARFLVDARFGVMDENALWRDLWLASRKEGSAEAAPPLAATAPLLLTYPPPLRDRMLPLASETLILSDHAPVAEEILNDRPADPTLGLARAFAARARGDALANGRDQLTRARAATQAVELRLATGRITAAEAADALDRLLYAWCGDGRDPALRRRVAELRGESGAWRAAFALLREAAADFAAQAEQVREWRTAAFNAFAGSDALDRLDAMDLVGLPEENTDLLPVSEHGDRLRAKLAERLIGLELPRRADAVLARLMRHAPTDHARAIYGTRFADLRLREGQAESALAALGESAWSDMPEPQKTERRVLTATALARMGNTKGALNALSGLDSEPARELRATVLEQAGDWPAAKTALAALAWRSVPDEDELEDSHRRILLRLASAAARAGDEATLAMLRERETGRMGVGRMGEVFRLLTADSLRAPTDLARSARELDLVKALPDGLKAVARP